LTVLLALVGTLIACEGAPSTATSSSTRVSEPTKQADEASTPASAVPTTPDATVASRPTRTPNPIVTATMTLSSPDFEAAKPLATAPAIRFAGWSPDSRWVAYWASSQEDVKDSAAYGSPAGTLHFVGAETGQICAASGIVARDRTAGVHWSADGAVVIITADGVFTGRPCQAEPYTPLVDYVAQDGPQSDPARSPDGRYRAATMLTGSQGGILTFETTLTARDGSQPLQLATWQIDERLGDYDLMGQWISQKQFLVYETLTEGPLILDVDEGIISVLSDLFGLTEVPSILDDRGFGLRAVAATSEEAQTYHLLLTGVGQEDSFPATMLYHAESGVVETLPYRYAWWTPFSADRQWLLMDERPNVDGYESHAIWIRGFEDVDGEWQLLATGVDSLLWSTDGTEMAFNDDAHITWQTFPDAASIGSWDTGEYWTRPVGWSPSGRFLAAEGNMPGEWKHGLFVLERPTSAGSAVRPSESPSPSPTPPNSAEVVAPLAGLVYRTADGLWRVDAEGQPELLVANPEARISPDGRRALRSDGVSVWVIDLETGAERNLLPRNDRPICCPQWAGADTILYGSWPEGAEPGPSTGHLSAAAADGSWTRVLDGNSASIGLPAVSADGRTIAYDLGDSAWLYDWDSGPQQLDVEDFGMPQTKSLKIGSPAWSPDGRQLAWIVGGGFGTGGGHALGLALVELETRTAQLRHLYDPIGVGGWPPAPVWSPDGQWLALITWELNDKSRPMGNLWVLSADGSAEDQLLLAGVGSSTENVIWSPDGRWLLFTQNGGGKATTTWRVEIGAWGRERADLPSDATVLGWLP
jgi:WD40 repeat protein